MKRIKKILIGSALTLGSLIFLINNENVCLASEVTANAVYENRAEEVTYDGSVYSEELEYVKYCLKKLHFTDHKDRELYIDGYYDKKGKYALDSFLASEGFEYFSEESRDYLFKKAEDSIDNYDSGFSRGSNKLLSTMFMYSDISNIDDKRDPFYSMGVLKEFENIVVTRPDQMSYNSLKVINHVKDNSNVFGYINLGPNNPYSPEGEWIQADLNKLKAEIDDIADANWHGVFIDQFGYDWGETRERQNIIIDYAHARGLSVMANAWHPEDALGVGIDTKANPQGIASSLNSNDWSVIESFYTDGIDYRADSSYIEKYLKTKKYSDETGVKIATLSYKRNSANWSESTRDIENSYVLAHVLGFEGWWFAKYDNSNKFHYGAEPKIDLGYVISGLKLESANKYVAETQNYIIEYFAEETPTLNLISK